ncbi:hypothetical protein F2Q70_00020548 [Brassica cretica]|uniref:Protein kinase domain-containing protein n=1 Tax=Brassica cretica TaxID=69181 RepID=A0A8S9GI80_BRACR|nr:hypothetical protein F2Q70_00020548 [Brassica cretica]
MTAEPKNEEKKTTETMLNFQEKLQSPADEFFNYFTRKIHHVSVDYPAEELRFYIQSTDLEKRTVTMRIFGERVNPKYFETVKVTMAVVEIQTKDLVKRTTTIGLMRSTDVLMTKFNRLKVTITITPQEGDKCCHVEWTTEAEELSDNRRDKTFIRRTVDLIHGIIRKKLRTDRLSPRSVVFSSSVDRRSPSYSRAEKVSTQTTKKGISKSKPSPRKAPPKHAATQVSDATQLEICLKVVTSQAFASAGRRRLACVADQRRRLSYPWRSTRKSMASGNSTSSSILRLILQIGQGMYISVFGAREPETGRILAFKKARGSKRLMQDVDACVRKLKVEALARARKEFVHISNGFVLCRKSNKVEKDHDKSYIWWLMVKRVL